MSQGHNYSFPWQGGRAGQDITGKLTDGLLPISAGTSQDLHAASPNSFASSRSGEQCLCQAKQGLAAATCCSIFHDTTESPITEQPLSQGNQGCGPRVLSVGGADSVPRPREPGGPPGSRVGQQRHWTERPVFTICRALLFEFG